MIGIGILGWLLMLLLGWSGTTVAAATGSDAGSGSSSSLGPVADGFFGSTPRSCGRVGEDVSPRESRHAWACLAARAEAGRAAQLMRVLDHSTVAYYRVTADGALEVYTDRLDGGDLTVIACPAPADLSLGCP